MEKTSFANWAGLDMDIGRECFSLLTGPRYHLATPYPFSGNTHHSADSPLAISLYRCFLSWFLHLVTQCPTAYWKFLIVLQILWQLTSLELLSHYYLASLGSTSRGSAWQERCSPCGMQEANMGNGEKDTHTERSSRVKDFNIHFKSMSLLI